jgi:hypothetical protein
MRHGRLGENRPLRNRRMGRDGVHLTRAWPLLSFDDHEARAESKSGNRDRDAAAE